MNTEPTRMTQDHHGSAKDRPGPTPDHAGPNTVSTRMTPDRPGPSRMRYGLSRTAPNPTRTAQDSPLSEAFLYQESCIFVYFLF